jgi:hypothetical protein
MFFRTCPYCRKRTVKRGKKGFSTCQRCGRIFIPGELGAGHDRRTFLIVLGNLGINVVANMIGNPIRFVSSTTLRPHAGSPQPLSFHVSDEVVTREKGSVELIRVPQAVISGLVGIPSSVAFGKGGQIITGPRRAVRTVAERRRIWLALQHPKAPKLWS